MREGREETRKLSEEMREWWKQKHADHIKNGRDYEKNCEVCRGEW